MSWSVGRAGLIQRPAGPCGNRGRPPGCGARQQRRRRMQGPGCGSASSFSWSIRQEGMGQGEGTAERQRRRGCWTAELHSSASRHLASRSKGRLPPGLSAELITLHGALARPFAAADGVQPLTSGWRPSSAAQQPTCRRTLPVCGRSGAFDTCETDWTCGAARRGRSSPRQADGAQLGVVGAWRAASSRSSAARRWAGLARCAGARLPACAIAGAATARAARCSRQGRPPGGGLSLAQRT